MTLGTVAQRLDHGREHIVPIFHLNGENGQANTKLNSNGFGSGGEMLQQ